MPPEMDKLEVDVRIMLSALWVARMLTGFVGDVLKFYEPGMAAQILAGEVDGMALTEGFLLAAAMTKENVLTIRWNNVLSLGVGIPTLIYIVVAFSTSMWLGRGGLIGLSIFGALF